MGTLEDKLIEIEKKATERQVVFDALITDTSIVRHAPKIRAVQENAVFVREESTKHGSFGRFIDSWDADDFSGLLGHMKTNGARLGGTTGWRKPLNFRDGYWLERRQI